MLGKIIARERRKIGMTQEQLAQRLDVTNQAVSKWETDQSCPDTLLLPRIADVLGISIDALFDREVRQEERAAELPWEDDGAFHIVVYRGRSLLDHAPQNDWITFAFEGPAEDVYCALDLSCQDVAGNVSVQGNVACGDVAGHVDAQGSVECGDVAGNLACGDYVECGDVEGSISAGSYVECGDVGGNITCGAYVECSDVAGSVSAGGYLECGAVSGKTKNNADDTGGKKFSFNFNPFK